MDEEGFEDIDELILKGAFLDKEYEEIASMINLGDDPMDNLLLIKQRLINITDPATRLMLKANFASLNVISGEIVAFIQSMENSEINYATQGKDTMQ